MTHGSASAIVKSHTSSCNRDTMATALMAHPGARHAFSYTALLGRAAAITTQTAHSCHNTVNH